MKVILEIFDKDEMPCKDEIVFLIKEILVTVDLHSDEDYKITSEENQEG